jgi:hypothetical protein
MLQKRRQAHKIFARKKRKIESIPWLWYALQKIPQRGVGVTRKVACNGRIERCVGKETEMC